MASPSTVGVMAVAADRTWSSRAGEPARAVARRSARYAAYLRRGTNAPAWTPAQRWNWSGSSGSALIAHAGTFSRCHGSSVP